MQEVQARSEITDTINTTLVYWINSSMSDNYGNKAYVVTDDFYETPYTVRSSALSQSYSAPPGLDPANPQNGGAAMRATCAGEIERYAREKIEGILGAAIVASLFQFRYTLAAFPKRAVCHFDDFDFTAVMYLTLPQHCQGGTSFFRHRPTDHASFDPDSSSKYNFADPAQWEEVDRVPMKFNRMVVYPGKLFHSPTPPFFGDTIENARLSQTMFIRVG